MFSSTIRYNLDPFGIHTDIELWNALDDAHIKEYIAKQDLGLSMLVEEGGKNFSVGQVSLLLEGILVKYYYHVSIDLYIFG